jgi:diacylglycerol kinase (ATP)
VSDVFVVFNPRSGKGRGATLVEPVMAALRDAGVSAEHGLTTAAGDEARVTREALGLGFRRIVAVGGDGTWSNVAGAILGSGLPASLGFVAGGTGCDLAKSLGLDARNPQACARVVRDGRTRTIDVGRVEGRHFLNVVGFGFDIAVIEDSWRVTWLGGDLLYLYCAVRQLARFPGFDVEVAEEGASARKREMLMLVIANARIFGGGFKIAPEADLADGLLDAVYFANMPLAKRLPLMLKLLKGTHGRSPDVSQTRGRSFRLRFDTPPAYETDGEWNRAQSNELLVESVPAALSVMVAG